MWDGNSYIRKLQSLSADGYALESCDSRLLLLTGQSSFTTSALSQEKKRFLQSVAPKEVVVTPIGFPWHHGMDLSAQDPNIVMASIRNARQTRWARKNGVYTGILASCLSLAMKRTKKSLFIVTGSCGAELLGRALGLSAREKDAPELHVTMLGPVGFSGSVPVTKSFVIQGARDIWSKALWRNKVDARPQCGHLDYYHSPEVMESTREFFEKAYHE